MEKYSKWRDPATGIQPFLPPIAPSSASSILIALSWPLCLVTAVLRVALLSITCLLHVLLVEGAFLVLETPIAPIHRLISRWTTTLTCRLALGIMGYFWIEEDIVAPKRGSQPVSQSLRSSRGGDLIISNWTSYVDILYLAYKHDPIFLLPLYGPSESKSTTLTGRHTGTGSAAISTKPSPSPPFLGYVSISLLGLIARTGSLPPSSSSSSSITPFIKVWKSLRLATASHPSRSIAVLPEATTSNNRSMLRFGDQLLADEDLSEWRTGICHVHIFKHPPPTDWQPSSTCSLPIPLLHLFTSLCWTPFPPIPRNLTVKTLHPSASPSSPSFLPTEILANSAGGLEGVGKDGKGAWREAIAVVMAETARMRRVKGMGWVEKAAFLDYWRNSGSSKKRK